MEDLLKQLEEQTIVDRRNRTAIVPYELFYQFAAYVQQLEAIIKVLQMQRGSGNQLSRPDCNCSSSRIDADPAEPMLFDATEIERGRDASAGSSQTASRSSR